MDEHKVCFKCNEDMPLTEFYAHKSMKDGHLNKCIECAKKDSLQTRQNNLEYYREYDRHRNKTEHRRKKKTLYKREFRKTHPWWAAFSCAKRRAYKKQATPLWVNQ